MCGRSLAQIAPANYEYDSIFAKWEMILRGPLTNDVSVTPIPSARAKPEML